MIKLSLKMGFLFIFAVSCCAVSASLFAEHVLHLQPCKLCYIQRWLYIPLLPIAFMGAFSKWKTTARWSCFALILLNFGVSTYHGLVQFKLIDDRCVMTRNINDISSFTTLLTNEEKACSKITWKISGFPISVINSFTCSLLLALILNSKMKLKDTNPFDESHLGTNYQ